MYRNSLKLTCGRCVHWWFTESQCPLSTLFLLCTDIECAWCGSEDIPLKKQEPLALNIKVDKSKQKIL